MSLGNIYYAEIKLLTACAVFLSNTFIKLGFLLNTKIASFNNSRS